MTTNTKTVATYEIAMSEQEWEPNGWYPEGHAIRGFSYYSYGPYRSRPSSAAKYAEDQNLDVRAEVIKWADESYGLGSSAPSGSYKLRETIHTVTTVEEKSEDRKSSFVSKTESTKVEIFHEYYRTEEQTEEYREKKRIRDAEWAITSARWDKEQAERVEARKAEEALAAEMAEEYDARIAKARPLLQRILKPYKVSA